MLPSVFPRLATDSAGRVFPGVWKPLFLKFPSRDGLPFPGRSSLPTSFVSFFVFYIFSYLFLKTMVCFCGCLMYGFCFVFLVIAGYLAISVVQNSMQTLYQTIPVARGWFYMPFPIGALMSLFQIVNVGYKRIKAAEDAEPEAETAAAEI